MTSQNIEQKIPYSLQQVKDALDCILTRFKSTYLNQQVNALFNTYSFGTTGCIYNVTLNEVDADNTLVKITCSSRNAEDVTSSASVTSYITEFTNILTAQLQGKSDAEMSEVLSHNNSSTSDGNLTGVLQFIIAIISIIALIYVFSI